MKLSVIIVSYNVCHFLEQALYAVRRALEGLEGEVWVVDNHSSDATVRMVERLFPEVNLIVNAGNPGFSIANNQAISLSSGDYVLLLNPDTLVSETTFVSCIEYMEAHADVGALGVRMIDGSGQYLPESKRGFPSPWVSFCKTTGLSHLFPKSKLFGRYYLGHLSADVVQSVDVLTGAFMFMRRRVLDEVGFLDEAFFMYGEDIDLSYRIQRAGFRNVYLPGPAILHYKGESTRKGSLNYIRTFYQAMIIFAGKHFRGRKAGIFVAILRLAIWLRAGLTLFRTIWNRVWLPVFDAVLIYLGLILLKDFWASYYYKDPTWFKPNVLWFNFPLYVWIWLGSAWLSGAYDNRYDLRALLRGLGFGTLILAAVYGFLDLDYRPSRALVLMGAVWAMVWTVGLRLLLHLRAFGNLNVGRGGERGLIIVGSAGESGRVIGLLDQLGFRKQLIGYVVCGDTRLASERDDSVGVTAIGRQAVLGSADQLTALVHIYGARELIFCLRDTSVAYILSTMQALGPRHSYRMVADGGMSIVGSSSKDYPGELYTMDLRYNLSGAGQMRHKRLGDLLVCCMLIVLLPIWLIQSDKRGTIGRCWFSVFFGRRHWLGYSTHYEVEKLPYLRAGVFTLEDSLRGLAPSPVILGRLNFIYARDWSLFRDLELLYQIVFKSGARSNVR
jgi:GT2 family glycosyltransferase